MRRDTLFLALTLAAGVLTLGVAFAAFGGSSLLGGGDKETAAVQAPTATPEPQTAFSGATFNADVINEAQFIWPAIGPVTQHFDASQPGGIAISLVGNDDLTVRASAAGTVTFTGGDPCCDNGLYIVVNHGGGLTTLYGNLSQVLVTANQEVGQGQVIGTGGVSGSATTRQVYFELRSEGLAQNPLRYLSSTPSTASIREQNASCPADGIDLSPSSWATITFAPATAQAAGEVTLTSATVSATGSSFELAALGELSTNDTGVRLNVPRTADATGRTSRFKLSLVFDSPEGRITTECELRVTTQATQRNVVVQAEPDNGSTEVPPPAEDLTDQPEADATATPGPSSPTKAPTKAATPTAVGTATPIPTRGPPQGLTPNPPKGYTPTSPKPATPPGG